MNAIDPLFERLEAYVKVQMELFKYKAIEQITMLLSSLLSSIVVYIFFAIFFLFINLSLSFWLGEILERTYYGFAAVAVFYGIIGLIIHFFMRANLKTSISNFIISNSIKQEMNSDE